MTKQYDFDWKTLVQQQISSGMNMKKFCEENNLPYQAFKNHKYALQASESHSPLFLPVKTEEPKMIELIINGNLISFDSSLDDEYVSRILRAMAI